MIFLALRTVIDGQHELMLGLHLILRNPRRLGLGPITLFAQALPDPLVDQHTERPATVMPI